MRGAAAILLAASLSACAAAPGAVVAPPRADPRAPSELLVPEGNGSLLQDQITLTLETDSLTLKVTPLEEWVLRLTAPDTWTRLSALAGAQRAEIARQTGIPGPALFLVSFFSRSPGTAFHPQDVRIENRLRLLRPVAIRPLTAGWGTERLGQERPELAVYAFPAEVDLEQSLSVAYGGEVADGWGEILLRLEAERGRALGRAGVGR